MTGEGHKTTSAIVTESACWRQSPEITLDTLQGARLALPW